MDLADRSPSAVEAALRQVLVRYCRGVDQLDHALTLGCFVPHAPVDYVGIYSGPVEGFVDFVMARHRELLGHFHMIGNVLVESGDDRTRTETYVTITLWKRTAEGVSEVLVRGRYLDEWQPDGQTWHISRRVHLIDLRTVDGRPDTSVLAVPLAGRALARMVCANQADEGG
jgi:SnoaL-like protein